MTVRHIPAATVQGTVGVGLTFSPKWFAYCTCGQEYQAPSQEGAEEALAAHLRRTRSLGREIETGPEQGEQMRFEEGA